MVHRLFIIFVSDMGAGCCLRPEGSGVSLGEGGEGEPEPPGGEKDKQSTLSEGRDNMGKDKSEVMKKDRHEQSEQLSSQYRKIT
jgi:hypothetical protein